MESESLNVTSRTYSLLCKPRLHVVVNATEINTGKHILPNREVIVELKV